MNTETLTDFDRRFLAYCHVKEANYRPVPRWKQEIMHELAAALTDNEKQRDRAEMWRTRWAATFGALLLLIAALLWGAASLWWMRLP